jgi:hypothetical protein
MLTKILVVLAAAIVLLPIVVSSRSSKLHVERSMTVGAPPERAFAQVNEALRATSEEPPGGAERAGEEAAAR